MGRPRKWTFEALDPTDPSGQSMLEVWIDQGTVDFLTRGNLSPRFWRIQCIPEVVRRPLAVFRGWNRDGFDEAFCYVGRPQDRPKEGIELPPQQGRCFLVFVLPTGKIEEWGWEAFDPQSEQDCRQKFGESWRQAWPSTQTT